MRVYRFAVYPEENGYLFLECIDDPKLFTQAKLMDEALLMARDVIASMYEIGAPLIEFVIPPDVVTKYEIRRKLRIAAPKKHSRGKLVLASH
jgi:hypothetical protein